jgi:hypothetical protein
VITPNGEELQQALEPLGSGGKAGRSGAYLISFRSRTTTFTSKSMAAPYAEEVVSESAGFWRQRTVADWPEPAAKRIRTAPTWILYFDKYVPEMTARNCAN